MGVTNMQPEVIEVVIDYIIENTEMKLIDIRTKI